MTGRLLGVTLREFDGAVGPLEQVPPGGIRPSLDIDGATFERVDGARAAVEVGFGLVLAEPAGDELVADLSATFRLMYEMPDLVSLEEQREFAATRAAGDAWPYWLTFLQGAMASMGLVPVRLSGSVPPELAGHVRRAFDQSRSLRDGA